MRRAIEFTLNGRPVRLEDCSPNLTLLEYLRRSGLTGAKEGCAEGDCGACSVIVVDRDTQGGTCYRAINSCLVPVCLLAGRELLSVEGVGKSHPVQARMVEQHGSQCGYCTPGVVMSLFEGFYRGNLREPDRLNDQLCGNLCRCTGYRPIRDAARAAFADRGRLDGEDRFADRLQQPTPALGEIDYETGGERFLRPTSLLGLLQALRTCPEARVIAGATELGLDITKRFQRFATLVSVEAVPELTALTCSPTQWEIGAAVTLTDIEERMAGEFTALGDMLRVFGSRQIRNRATMGGNIVTASPIGDSAPWLLAADASVRLASLNPQDPSQIECRTLPIDDFFVAYRKTALRPGEVLRSIIVPRAQPAGGVVRHWSWFKVSKRREMDISTVAACFRIDLAPNRVVIAARLTYGGVAPTPARARKTEQALDGRLWDAHTVQQALPILASEFTPISDARGSSEYRRSLIGRLLEKFFSETTEPARDGNGAPAQLTVPPSASVPPHESGHLHVTGEALYTDDLAARRPMLEVWPVGSPVAHAKILTRDASVARQMPGIRTVLLAEDIPGLNNAGPVKRDEPLLAKSEVSFHGQIVALVVGETLEACCAAAEKVIVEYQPLPAILTLPEALARHSFHNTPNFIRRGQVQKALTRAPHRLEGTIELGGQEHFYLETQAAWAEPGEDGTMRVTSSTQHPSEVQNTVAHVLGVPAAKVVVQCPRIGGGFGGKETQAAAPAALAALAARLTGQAVRVRWNRDQDMILTGHRHPFLAKFKVGFDAEGHLLGARIHLYSNGGWALDLSQAVTDRALFHLDNAYYIPAAEFRGQVAKTHLSSNTAFRGFGGPQGMVVIEEILDRVARRLNLPPELVRQRNLYHGKGTTNTTPYGQNIGDNRIQTIWRELEATSEFAARRREIAAWNAAHPNRKRGLAITPVKFGISFTVTHLNQAGALVLLYQDGTAQVNHSATEMGQGVHTNVRMIAARELGLPLERIRVMATSTDKVPNTSATAASCGTDLNGAAVKNACATLRLRLAPVAARLLRARLRRPVKRANIVFAGGLVSHKTHPAIALPFAEVVREAYRGRISLSASGYYATPGIHWDRAAGRGKPFHYFACGAAVTEVEVDGFTGMMRVLRADILHDAGESINAGVNRGQVEGGYLQGLGWLTSEELIWDNEGRLLTHSPDTYKIPAAGDAPQVFNVRLLSNAAQKNVVYGSKAVGEPPFMLAISAREAIRDAVAAFGSRAAEVPLPCPATPEGIFKTIQLQQRREKTSPPAPAPPVCQ